MTEKITIALDCMGGDNAPLIVIGGAELIAASDPNIHFLLYGNESLIKPFLSSCNYLRDNHTLIHTDQVVTAEDKPSIALRKAVKSSMRLAINSLKNQESQAVVSAGNTGALMAISKVVLRHLPTIDRPAIITFLPNQKKKSTVMLDMGANIECNSEVLYQFAAMGHAFAKIVLKIANPTIGLLNVGSEDLKGSDAVRNAATLIKESDLAPYFYGYIEGDDIIKGTVDVVVTDGFCGNVALKAIEGTAKMISSFLKEGFNDSLLSKIGYLLSSFSLNKVFKQIDPKMHNGAMLVGLNGVVVKSHGGTDKIGFANAISVAASLVRNKINEQILNEVKSMILETEDKRADDGVDYE